MSDDAARRASRRAARRTLGRAAPLHRRAHRRLPRSGASLATGPLLEFQLAHARARDAVHEPLDEARLVADLAGLGVPVLAVASAAADRQQYLMRPDLGRRARAGGRGGAGGAGTAQATATTSRSSSPTACRRARCRLMPGRSWPKSCPPSCRGLAHRAAGRRPPRPGRDRRRHRERVACAHRGDADRRAPGPVVARQHGRLSDLARRRPAAATTDADRNCISNIRPEGIGYADAAFKLAHLLRAMRARGMSGVQLKDDGDRLLIENDEPICAEALSSAPTTRYRPCHDPPSFWPSRSRAGAGGSRADGELPAGRCRRPSHQDRAAGRRLRAPLRHETRRKLANAPISSGSTAARNWSRSISPGPTTRRCSRPCSRAPTCSCRTSNPGP